jgi:hypothetical protein
MESLENLVMFELIYCLHFAAGKASEKEAFARLKKRSPFYLTANFQLGTGINKNFFKKAESCPDFPEFQSRPINTQNFILSNSNNEP